MSAQDLTEDEEAETVDEDVVDDVVADDEDDEAEVEDDENTELVSRWNNKKYLMKDNNLYFCLKYLTELLFRLFKNKCCFQSFIVINVLVARSVGTTESVGG